MQLQSVDHWFLDLDGTVYLDEEPLPGALELIRHFRENDIGYTFLTNNSSRSANQYAERLHKLGFPVDDGQVYTSGEATASYLAKAAPTARIYVLGTPSLAAVLSAAGLEIVEDEPDLVVLGFDPALSYTRLAKACNFLMDPAVRFVATNPDANCPVRGGFLPDAGAVMALIEVSCGRSPELVVGKPNPNYITEVAGLAGAPLQRSAMVGDRLETDVLMAKEVGIPGVLVLTGATKANDPRLAGDSDTPVFSGVDGLLAHLQGAVSK